MGTTTRQKSTCAGRQGGRPAATPSPASSFATTAAWAARPGKGRAATARSAVRRCLESTQRWARLPVRFRSRRRADAAAAVSAGRRLCATPAGRLGITLATARGQGRATVQGRGRSPPAYPHACCWSSGWWRSWARGRLRCSRRRGRRGMRTLRGYARKRESDRIAAGAGAGSAGAAGAGAGAAAGHGGAGAGAEAGAEGEAGAGAGAGAAAAAVEVGAGAGIGATNGDADESAADVGAEVEAPAQAGAGAGAGAGDGGAAATAARVTAPSAIGQALVGGTLHHRPIKAMTASRPRRCHSQPQMLRRRHPAQRTCTILLPPRPFRTALQRSLRRVPGMPLQPQPVRRRQPRRCPHKARWRVTTRL